MSQDIRQLEQLGQRQRDTASAFCDAATELARAANSTSGRVIPAPVVYDILGNIKTALGALGEVVDYLPIGLNASFQDDKIKIYDRGVDGQDRDPTLQAGLAISYLTDLRESIQAAAAAAEAAQTAVNGQGYTALDDAD